MKFLSAESNPAEITSSHLDKFINSDLSQLRHDGKPRKSGSIANTKAALSSFFKWLQNSGQINHNPVINTRIVKNKNIPNYLSQDEVKALLKTIKETRGWPPGGTGFHRNRHHPEHRRPAFGTDRHRCR